MTGTSSASARPALLLVCPAVFLAAVLACTQVRAASYSSSVQPPSTGMTPPDTPLKGRNTPVIGSFSDAYGNPITGVEQEREPRKRLPSGAYGGYGRSTGGERPLPDVKDERPVW